MMRYFAHTMKTEKHILWLLATSKDDIHASLLKYAQQLGAGSLNITDPASFIAQKIDEKPSLDFLIIFDGLDNPSINLGPYLFSDKINVRIFITTQRRQLGSEIRATHEMQVTPLDDDAGQDLLTTVLSTLSNNGDQENALHSDERAVLRNIVQCLGGLPLAISIVGTFLRISLGITRQGYLSRFSEEAKSLLGRSRSLPDYPNSVWEAFQISFNELLNNEDEPWSSARAMAFFIASLDERSALNEWIRICHRVSCSAHPHPRSRSNFVDTLGFLETENKFLLSFQTLTSVNLITFDPTYGRSEKLPSIEMHSLIRDWLRSKPQIQPAQYLDTRLWLLGFVIHEDLLQTQMSSGRYDLLTLDLLQRVRELNVIHDSGSGHPGDLDICFPFLIRVIDQFRASLGFLQPGSEPYQRLFQAMSNRLASEMRDYFVDELKHLEWDTIFDDFTSEAEQQVEFALEKYPGGRNFDLIKFFVEALDENASLAIAFNTIAPEELKSFSHIALIESIKQQIVYELRRSTVDYLNKEALQQAVNIFRGSKEEAHDLIINWEREWTKDVVAMIRENFRQVVRRLIPELALQNDGIRSQSSFGTSNNTTQQRETHNSYRAIAEDTTLMNAFFATLHRSALQATQNYLDNSATLETLQSKRHNIGNRMKTVILQTLGDQAVEKRKIDCFHLLWEIGWGARFDACLPDWIGAEIVDSISEALNKAARKGLEEGFRTIYKTCVPPPMEELIISQFMEEIWDNNSSVSLCFPNWILSGWFTSPATGVDQKGVEEALSGCCEALDQAWCAITQAMHMTYGSAEATRKHDTISRAIKGIIRCRKELHTVAMIPLTKPDVDDETGLGPYLGMLTFQESDSFLFGLQHVVGRDMFSGLEKKTLEELIEKEQNAMNRLPDEPRRPQDPDS
jgi:hypothetical protein